MGSSAQNSSGVHWCRRRVRFNAVSEKVRFGAEPGQVQQGSEEGSGEGSGEGRLWCRAKSGSTGFRRRFQRRSGRLWCRARSGSTGFREGSGEGSGRLWRRDVQSQVRFNRVPEKVPGEWEALVQSQVKVNRVPEKVPENGRLWCKVPGSLGAKPSQVQRVPRRLQKPSQVRFI